MYSKILRNSILIINLKNEYGRIIWSFELNYIIAKKILSVNIVFKLSDANNKMSINAETSFQNKYFKKWYGYITCGVNITSDILKN